MNEQRTRIIHLSRLRGMSRPLLKRFFRFDPTLKHLYLLSPAELSHLFSIPMHRAELIHRDLHDPLSLSLLKRDEQRFSVITIVDEHYPGVLKKIKDPPIVLYTWGNNALLQAMPAISIIGTRHPSHEAKQKMAYIMEPLLKQHFIVVSGMAQGIDSYAHQMTLDYNGHTIAVLGSGFDHIYPKHHQPLFHQIAKQGLLISEYPPHIPPRRHHFPERNRIISGLSFGTLVIEAMAKSGTLITVGQALDQGREVYAVPGSPLIPQTIGCHQLIQEGAKLVMNGHEIIEDWHEIGKYLYDSIENGS